MHQAFWLWTIIFLTPTLCGNHFRNTCNSWWGKELFHFYIIVQQNRFSHRDRNYFYLSFQIPKESICGILKQ